MKYIITFFLWLLILPFFSQEQQYYKVVKIDVVGNETTSDDAIIIISGLKLGGYITMPSSKIQLAVKKLWNERVFYDIKISKEIEEKGVKLILQLKEYHLLGEIKYEGVNSSEENKLQKNGRIKKLKRYSPNTISEVKRETRKMLIAKGYRNLEIKEIAKTDSLGRVNLTIKVNKGRRLKVGTIDFFGNSNLDKTKLIKEINEGSDYDSFKSSKYFTQPNRFLKKTIENVYQSNGYIDIRVDSIIKEQVESKVNFAIWLTEGVVYDLDKIEFEGNKIFTTEELSKIIEPLIGKSYRKGKLEEKLFFEENRRDITSLYLDNGFANFRLKFREEFAEGNKVRILVSLEEGEPFVYGNITFKGNVRTKDKVLHQTVITSSGMPFSRSKIILSQQKLTQLDYFIPEEFDVEMKIDTSAKTVDITYLLKERISDRFLVSGGFDGTYLIGSLGFDFKNFELSDVFKKGTKWNPLPAGGGQHLSLKGQSDAANYYGLSFKFEEPRFRNKRMGVGLSSDYAYYRDGESGNLKLFSSQIGVSHFPNKNNPFLRLSHQINYRYYQPQNYNLFDTTGNFSTGFYNSFGYKASLVEQTTNNTFYPSKGHLFKLEGMTTLPTSLIKKNISSLSNQDKYKWLEYYKLKASLKHYLPIGKSNKTVLASTVGVGYLGRYNKELNIVPFERFEMGGTGITNYSINANDIIGLRGYDAGSLSNDGGDPIALKMSVELRHKLVSFDKWMMTGHLFYENGNTLSLGDNLNLNHAVGIGSKLYIPLLGVVGVDCGWGLNKVGFQWKEPTVQFTIGLDVGDF